MKSYAERPARLAGTLAVPRRALRRAPRALREAVHLPLPVRIGRALLALLFLVIPVFNPALYRAGDERLYLGTVIVLGAAVALLPSLRLPHFRWIVWALVLAIVYVLETGALRGDLALGVVGNSYRPIHPVLVFAASAVFLLGARREWWLRLFLAGGVIGCALAVLNTLVPAIDPFALSRPADLGWYGDAKFITSQRQAGAFVYPGNFGPYAAYVAIAGLVALERARGRLFSLNLYSLALAFGMLGIAVSGSRAAALGLVVAAIVVMWRSPPLRLPLLVTALVGAGLLAAVAWVTGVLAEIVQSRVGQADLSLSLRFESWEAAWHAFVDNPLFGGGVIPNTTDSTLFYYLGVGGLVGLALVLAMYWVSLLRPVRSRDWSSLPIVLAVLAIGITQDSFGQPLASWAFAAAIFLVSSRASVDDVRPANRRTSAWLAAPFRARNYVALWNMVRISPDFPGLLKRYLTGGGAYPYAVRLRTPTGLVEATLFHPHDASTLTEVFCREDYEAPNNLRIAVDVGANIGISALYFLTRNRSSRCYCFEPDPRNVEKLRMNLAPYRDRYELDECAVSDRSALVDFGVEETGRYGGIGLETGRTITVEAREVNVLLDEILAREGRIDVLKLDVEGLERRILAAIRPDLLARVAAIYFESPTPGDDLDLGPYVHSRRGLVDRLVRS